MDKKSKIPLYMTVLEILKERIITGEYGLHTFMPVSYTHLHMRIREMLIFRFIKSISKPAVTLNIKVGLDSSCRHRFNQRTVLGKQGNISNIITVIVIEQRDFTVNRSVSYTHLIDGSIAPNDTPFVA